MEAKGIVAASQPRWIPVAERLPEKGAIVLTFDDLDEYKVQRYLGYDTVVHREAFAMETADVIDIYYYITHWMPLPAPPKAGD